MSVSSRPEDRACRAHCGAVEEQCLGSSPLRASPAPEPMRRSLSNQPGPHIAEYLLPRNVNEEARDVTRLSITGGKQHVVSC